MATEENNWIRIVLNWITPIVGMMTVVKMATKLIVKKASWPVAFLHAIISLLMGIATGGVTYIAYVEDINEISTDALWVCMVAASIMTFIGEKISHWFVFGFEIDKALDCLVQSFFQWLKNKTKI